MADHGEGEGRGRVGWSMLTVDDVRRRRVELQDAEDAVSYARRIAQARIDLVRRRLADDATPVTAALRDVLSHQAAAPSGRPPRSTDARDASAHAVELERLCTEHGFSRLAELEGPALERLAGAIEQYERQLSDERQRLFADIDALSDELVTRYRAGDADVDGLWDRADGRSGGETGR